jgi:hypothetical protein
MPAVVTAPEAILAVVTAESAMPAVVTAPEAILLVVTAELAILAVVIAESTMPAVGIGGASPATPVCLWPDTVSNSARSVS